MTATPITTVEQARDYLAMMFEAIEDTRDAAAASDMREEAARGAHAAGSVVDIDDPLFWPKIIEALSDHTAVELARDMRRGQQ